MKKLIVLLMFPLFIHAQLYRPQGFSLTVGAEDSLTRPRGNGIVDMLVQRDSILWTASGFGLSVTSNGGNGWKVFTSREYGGKGGPSALALMGDSTIWIATAFDTLAREEELPAGGGLRFSSDLGQTWTRIPQPIDSKDEQEYSPTTTVIQNITFDIAVLDTTVWIASFGGGLRRSDDRGASWQVVTTDGLPFSALQHLNHRAFSVISENGNLWVGTAQGISKSSDGGQTWRRFTHQNQDFPISGNFVVALAWQEYTNTIWAATIEAVDTSEVRAVSKSVNGGETWEVMLEGTFPHNFAFDDSLVYVAADEGLFVSADGGENWFELPPVIDGQTGEEILTKIHYSAAVTRSSNGKRLWVGSADGLASTADNGNSWTVYRSFISTRKAGVPAAYAYPSPFSPSRHDYIRFQFDIKKAGDVVVDIYDFALDKVATVREKEQVPSGGSFDRSVKWDGRREDGSTVASGVYFFRLKVNGKVHWGKLVIIN